MSAETILQKMEREGRARYAEQLAQGLHDETCEARERSRICNCGYRRRIAKGYTKPPVLVIQYPTCGECGGDLNTDGDVWTCNTCCVQWDISANDGDAGEFQDDYGNDLDDPKWGARLIEVLA